MRGDFTMGEREAQESLSPQPVVPDSVQPLAFAQLGQGRIDETEGTYQRVAKVSPPIAAAGLGDLALYQGRLNNAVAIFERGAAADIAAKSPDAAAEKLVALAYTQLTRGRQTSGDRRGRAGAGGRQRSKNQVSGGPYSGGAGAADRAREMAAGLASQLQAGTTGLRENHRRRSRAQERAAGRSG